jgi:HAD superfamily hydrolase (TIGR01549 family)
MVATNLVKSIFRGVTVVALDFDDTLCMTQKACFRLENMAAQAIGAPPMSEATHLATWGKPMTQVLQARFPGVDEQAFMRSYEICLIQAKREGWYDQITPKTYEALEKLSQMGLKLSIVTSRTLAELEHLMVADHPLTKLIKRFYYLDNCEHHKPDGRVFDGLLKDFGVSKEQVVYVGDSVSDAKACESAGIAFVASLESGLRTKEDFNGLPVHNFIHEFSELPILFGEK